MRALRWLSLLLLVAMVAGCAKPLQQTKDGRRPTVYNSIVSLSPGTTELIALGSMNVLRGRTSACNFPPYVSNVPVVGDTKPNIEKIAAVNPQVQLVIYDEALYTESDLAKLDGMGIELLPWGPERVADMPDALLDLGSKLGFEFQYAGLADRIEQAIEFAKGAVAGKQLKVALLMNNHIAGTNSFYADLVRSAGGVPIGPESDKYEPLNAEMLVEQNPDVILDLYGKPFEDYVNEVTNPSERDKRMAISLLRRVRSELLSDPRFQSITAIKNKSVASVHPDVFARRGARVDVAIKDVAAFLGTINE